MRVLSLALLAVLFLVGLGSTEAASQADEGLYLSVSSQMAQAGSWLDPTWDGMVSFHKPPLFYWCQRLAYLVFGERLFAGRLPSALASLALAVLTGALAGRLYGERARWGASLFLGTSLGLCRFGRLALMDAPLALAVTAGAYAAVRATEPTARRAWLVASGGCAAAAVLLKGPVGALLVGALVLAVVAARDRRALWSGWSLAALLAFVLLGAPWFVLAFARHGQHFYESFFLNENVSKFREAWTLSREGGFLLALPVLFFPWTALLLAQLPWRRGWKEPGVLVPLLWIALVGLVYSLPSVKFPHYWLPALPAVALLAARVEAPRWALWATGAQLAALGLGVALAAGWGLSAGVLALVLLSAGFLGAAAALCWRRRLLLAAAAYGVAFVLLWGLAVPAVTPRLLPAEVEPLVRGRSLFLFGLHGGVHRFAVGQTVFRAWHERHLRDVLAGGAAAMLSREELFSLSEDFQASVEVRTAWPRFRRRVSLGELWESFRARDLSRLHEEMVLVVGRPTSG